MLAYCHSASMLLRYGCSKALVVEHRQGLAVDYGDTIFMRGGKAMVIRGAASVRTAREEILLKLPEHGR
jgi:hypothetical protein